MEYRVKRIQRKEDIEKCERFQVSHAQWRCVLRPQTCGYLGYLQDQGLFLRMICEEADPRRMRKNHREDVWKDSAMEMFLAFPAACGGKDGNLRNDSLYLNFEVNANGAMYAQYGYGKKSRSFLPERVYEECGVRAEVEDRRWSIELLVPQWFLKEQCLLLPEGEESARFYCNFYKISEDPEIEHYLSYSEIQSESPNFHLPVFFAPAVLERD